MARMWVTSRRAVLRLGFLAGLSSTGLLSACGSSPPATVTTGTGTTARTSALASAPSTRPVVSPAATTTSATTSAATTSSVAQSTATLIPTPSPVPVQQGQTRIEFLRWFSEADQDKTGINAIDQMIKDFQAKHPSIVVQNVYGGHDAVLTAKLLFVVQDVNTHFQMDGGGK